MPNRIASRSDPRARQGTRGRHSASRITAANAMRSRTVPAGPSSSNSVVAIAAPSCTEATAPTTRAIDVARCPGSKRPRLTPVARYQFVQQLEILDQVAGAQESLVHPSARGIAEPASTVGIGEQLAKRRAQRRKIEWVVEQDAALPVHDLVLDPSPAARDDRPRLPHRLGDSEAEALREA